MRLSERWIEQRRRVQSDLFLFSQDILEYPDLFEPFHRPMCEAFEGGARNKVLAYAKDHFKSTLFTIAGPLWRVVRCFDPEVVEVPPSVPLEILIASDTGENSRKFLRAIKTHIDHRPRLRALFPELRRSGTSWKLTSATVDRKPEPSLKEDTFEATGAGANIVPRRFDLIVVDDLVGPGNYATQEGRDIAWDWFAMAGSLLKPRGQRVVVGHRWHEDDLVGRILTMNDALREEDRFEVRIQGCYGEDGEPVFPTRFSRGELELRRAQLGSEMFACNPYDAPILMADWSTKPIGDIKIGDAVVGWEERINPLTEKKHGGQTGLKPTRLVVSHVTAVNSREALTQKVYLQSGRVIRCTPDHNWYTGRYEARRPLYRPAVVGGSLGQVVNTDGDGRNFYYLAGIIDGEGCCKATAIIIAQSPEKNPEVHTRIREELEKLGLDYSVGKFIKGRPNIFTIKGGKQARFDILKGNPAKRNQLCAGFYRRGTHFIDTWDRVVKLEAHEFEKVYAVTTTTGNYVAWGYASKNCIFLNDPIDPTSVAFPASVVGFWDELPEGPMETAVICDPASSTGLRSDNSGIMVIGRQNGVCYTLCAEAVKMNWPDLMSRLFVLVATYKPRVLAAEMQAGQRSLEGLLRKEVIERNLNVALQVLKPDTHRLGAKDIRIRDLLSYFECGTLLLNRKQSELVQQVTHYPKAKRIDLLDALSYLPQVLPPQAGLVSGAAGKKEVVHVPGSYEFRGGDLPKASRWEWGWL